MNWRKHLHNKNGAIRACITLQKIYFYFLRYLGVFGLQTLALIPVVTLDSPDEDPLKTRKPSNFLFYL